MTLETDALTRIEELVSSDLLASVECDLYEGRLVGNEKLLAEVLMDVYMIAHANVERCGNQREDWKGI